MVAASLSSPADDAHDLADAIAPHVARSVTQARELTARAVEQTREVLAATGRDMAALKALTALKFVDADGAAARDCRSTGHGDSGRRCAGEATGRIRDGCRTANRSTAGSRSAGPASASGNSRVAGRRGRNAGASARELLPAQVSSNSPAGTEKNAPPVDRKKPEAAAGQRPDWIEHPSGREGDIYYETVMVERYSTGGEAEDALAEELQARTRAYVDRYLARERANCLPCRLHSFTIIW